MCSNKAPYRTLLRRGEAELIVNRSRFIGWAAPARTEEEALDLIAQARAAFRDASHHCYAYVVGVNRGIQRYSDAGEPQGTAGLPILDTLLRPDLTNCCAVVTRYFGGVLLGKGGLVRAYGQCAAAAVAAASPAEMVPTSRLLVEVDYALHDRVAHFLAHAPCRLEDQEFGASVVLTVSVRQADRPGLEAQMADLTQGRAEILLEWEGYDPWQVPG